MPLPCCICGGWKQKELVFSSKAAHACTSLVLLAIVSLVLPTFLSGSHPVQSFLQVSRYAAVVIFAVYLQLLYCQLCSHKDYFQGDEDAEDGEDR